MGRSPTSILRALVLAVTASLAFAAAPQAVTLEETANGGSTESSSVSTTVGVTGVTGDLYLASISTKKAKDVTSVTGLGLTWTRLAGHCSARSQTNVEIWMAQGAPTSSGTVTADLDGTPKSAVISVSRYSDVDQTTPIGSVLEANVNGPNGDCETGLKTASYHVPMTTTGTGSLIHAAVGRRLKPHMPGIGLTEIDEIQAGLSGNAAGVAVSNRAAAAAGSHTVSGAFSGSVTWALAAVEILAPTGPPPVQYTLTVNVTGTGTVELDPPGGTYNDGTVVTVTAVPGEGSLFDSWGDDLSGSVNPETITMDGDKTISALFEEIEGPFTLTLNIIGDGSVSTIPAGPDFPHGTVVTLTPVADPGNAFSAWGGDLSGNTVPETITMLADRTVSATFSPLGGGSTEVTHQETVTGSAMYTSSVSTDGDLTQADGHLYLASISAKRGHYSVTSVTGLGLDWSLVDTQCSSGEQTNIEIWMALGAPTEGGPVTAEFDGTPNGSAIAVSRYAGVNIHAPLGGMVSANPRGVEGDCSGSNRSSSYSFDITAGSMSMIYSAAAIRHKTHTEGAGYTERAEVTSGNPSNGDKAGVAVQDMAVTPAAFARGGSASVDGSFSGSLTWAVSATEILSAPGGNQAPFAVAGPDIKVQDSDDSGDALVPLLGNNSFDLDGEVVSHLWYDGATFLGSGLGISVMLPVGTHTITLTVADDDGATDSDTIEIVVEGSGPNTAPLVEAGPFQSLMLDIVTYVSMDASVTDDGLPIPPAGLTYRWDVLPHHPVDPLIVVSFSPDEYALNPDVTFASAGLYTFRLTAFDGEFTSFDEMQVLVQPEGKVPGPLETVPVPGPHNLADEEFDNLKNRIDGSEADWSEFVVDEGALEELGKALFWDMQLGSDGVQACASCHFHAGADNRFKNQLSPGLNAGDNTFDLLPPNGELALADFPFRKLTDPNDHNSSVISDVNDVASSQGVFGTTFNDIVPGSAIDDVTDITPDLPFHVSGFDVRRVEPRNTPTTINAVFNFNNFWDGRAFNNFNGVDPFGNRSPAKVTRDTDGVGGSSAEAVEVCLALSSLASQAVGPPLSAFEMSADGRIWVKIGKKMLDPGIVPLADQIVHANDSVLSSYSLSPAPGLSTTYAALIMQAFHSQWWDSDNILEFPNGDGDPMIVGAGSPVGTSQYTLMEANFSLFFGLAVQAYEQTLISDDTRFDRYRKGTGSLTSSELHGLSLFMDAGKCINCHGGSEFTGASVSELGSAEPGLPGEPVVREPVIEKMQMAKGSGLGTIRLVHGDAHDVVGLADVVLTFDPRGTYLEIKDAGTSDVILDGTMAFGDPGNTFPPGATCVEEEIAVAFALVDSSYVNALADAILTIDADCNWIMEISTSNLPIGFYDLYSNGIYRATLQVTADRLYDNGFYNIGVRPTAEDIGRGGEDPFGNPLSFTKMELEDPGRADIRKNVPHDFTTNGIVTGDELPAVDGAFKTPGLRNVELTGPYMHNGGQATLRQVVEFYNRGGDFAHENLDDLDPDIRWLGLSETDIDDLVAFMLTLTDERVRHERAPFDHPQLFIPDGHDDGTGVTIMREIPAVGAGGAGALLTFLSADPFTGEMVADPDQALVRNGPTVANGGEYMLGQNFPNPFKPNTTIHFSLPRAQDVRLEVYNVQGQKLKTLMSGTMEQGMHSASWDGTNDSGMRVAAGIYLYQLKTAEMTRTKKMILVR